MMGPRLPVKKGYTMTKQTAKAFEALIDCVRKKTTNFQPNFIYKFKMVCDCGESTCKQRQEIHVLIGKN